MILEAVSDVQFSPISITSTAMVTVNPNLIRLECATQNLAPTPEQVYDVPFMTGPIQYTFDSDFSLGVCSPLTATGYLPFTLTPPAPNNPIIQLTSPLAFEWGTNANSQTLPQRYNVILTQTFNDGTAIPYKISKKLIVNIMNSCRTQSITNLPDLTSSYTIGSATQVSVPFGPFVPSKAGCQMTLSLRYKNDDTEVPPGNCLFTMDASNNRVLIGPCNDISLVATSPINLYVRAELVDRASNALETAQRGYQNIQITIKGPCDDVTIQNSLNQPPVIEYVLRTPQIGFPINLPLFSFTNYPTIVSNCETYSLRDSSGTSAPSQGYISLDTVPNPMEIKIGPSTSADGIGTNPTQPVTLKIRTQISSTNFLMRDIPIVLKHECTNRDLAGKTDVTYTYQLLKDGTKTFSLDSFDITDPDPAAGLNCFKYSLAQVSFDTAYSDTYVKMTSYPNLVVGPTLKGLIGTDPSTDKNFRARGIVDINTRSPSFQNIKVTMLHECTGTFLTVFNPTANHTYNYVLNDPDLVIQLTGTAAYLQENGIYPELVSNNVECFEYDIYDQDPVTNPGISPSTLQPFIQFSYPTLTLTSPGPNSIGTLALFTQEYWLGGRVKINNQNFVSKNFTINVAHECSRAFIDSVVPSYPVEYVEGGTSFKFTFDLFDTTEVATTECIKYQWKILSTGGSYDVADSTNTKILSTFGYPDIDTAVNSPRVVSQVEQIKIFNLRVFAYNIISPLDDTKYSDVPLKVYHKCYVMPLNQGMKGINQEYALTDNAALLAIPKFLADTECSVKVDFEFYNITIDQATGVTTTSYQPLTFPNPYFSFNYLSYEMHVLVNQMAINFIGEHRIRMNARMEYGNSTSFQWINVTINCAMDKILPDESDLQDVSNRIMRPQSYTIGDKNLRISFRDFDTDPLYCGIPIKYTFKLQSGDPLPKFINGGNFIFTKGGFVDVFALSRKQVPDTRWTILITGEVPKDNPPVGNNVLITTMVLPLEIIIPNTGPPTLKSNPRDVKVKINEVGIIKLTGMSDPDWEDTPSLQQIDFGDAFNFVTGQFPNYKVVPIDNETDPGTYEVKLTLQDDNPAPQYTEYKFKIFVIPLPPALIKIEINQTIQVKRTPKKGAPLLETKLKSITNKGIATVTFSQDMKIPANISAIDDKVLAIQVLNAPGSNPRFLKITKWKVIRFTKRTMEIDLDFENPLRISHQSGMLDKLEIKFLEVEFFVLEDNSQNVDKNYIVRQEIPRQIGNDASTAMLLSSGGSTKGAMNTMMYGNLAVNLVMSASLQMLWGLINVMQLIVKMPLLNITFPQNAATFYTFISDVAAFDLLPSEQINNYVFSFTESPEEDTNFQTMGYESTNIIENLGSMAIYLVGFFCLVGLALIMRFLKNKYKAVEIVYNHLAKMIFWNMILRMILEGYIEYAISAMLNIQDLEWTKISDKISSVFAIVALVVIFAFPFLVWYLLWRKQQSLGENETIDSIGSTYQELKIKKKSALLYNVIYMLRRLLIAVLATVLKMSPYLQVQLIVLHSIGVIMYVSYVKPFEIPLLNYMEVFNESCILIATYHLFLFTDFVPDPELQYKIGWSIILVTIINIIVNMMVMVYASFKQLKLMCKKLKNLYDHWRNKGKAKKGIDLNKKELSETHANLKSNKNDLKIEDLEKSLPKNKTKKTKTSRSSSLKNEETKTISPKDSKKGGKTKSNNFLNMPPAKQRVTSLDEIRRMYNKNLTDFASFEEYQKYMEERTLKVMQLKKNGKLDGVKDDAGVSQLPPKVDLKMRKRGKREKGITNDMTVHFQGDGMNTSQRNTDQDFDNATSNRSQVDNSMNQAPQLSHLQKLFFQQEPGRERSGSGMSSNRPSLQNTQTIFEAQLITKGARKPSEQIHSQQDEDIDFNLSDTRPKKHK